MIDGASYFSFNQLPGPDLNLFMRVVVSYSIKSKLTCTWDTVLFCHAVYRIFYLLWISKSSLSRFESFRMIVACYSCSLTFVEKSRISV